MNKKKRKTPKKRNKTSARKLKEEELQNKIGSFYYIYGKSRNAIAEELDLCRNTVAKYLERARKHYLDKIKPGQSDEILAQAAARFELLANDAILYRMKATDDKRVRASRDATAVLKDQISFLQDVGLVDRVPAPIDVTLHDKGAEELLAAFIKDFDKKIDEDENGKEKKIKS